ncbi:hypothetical protein JRQ81_008542 [Phrynocephalus forsythii]|uniref:Integrase catalytic domain-containing protein n=1 Tax=Phrynocephalus forsythii TaxID=171643 RepID=A0A9Q0Y5F4_9SAUR|nr:hypothetical protein JRQ81_008542 [Phrynocephalus forsythii]
MYFWIAIYAKNLNLQQLHLWENVKGILILELLDTDLAGSFQSSLDGAKYYLIIVDDYSMIGFIYLLKHKVETERTIRNFVNWVEAKYNAKIAEILSDTGGEYTSNSLEKFLVNKGIKQKLTSSQQSEIAERKNQYLQEMFGLLFLEGEQSNALFTQLTSFIFREKYKHCTANSLLLSILKKFRP